VKRKIWQEPAGIAASVTRVKSYYWVWWLTMHEDLNKSRGSNKFTLQLPHQQLGFVIRITLNIDRSRSWSRLIPKDFEISRNAGSRRLLSPTGCGVWTVLFATESITASEADNEWIYVQTRIRSAVSRSADCFYDRKICCRPRTAVVGLIICLYWRATLILDPWRHVPHPHMVTWLWLTGAE